MGMKFLCDLPEIFSDEEIYRMQPSPASILKYMDGNSSNAEVESFIPDVGGRLGHESPESFEESTRTGFFGRLFESLG